VRTDSRCWFSAANPATLLERLGKRFSSCGLAPLRIWTWSPLIRQSQRRSACRSFLNEHRKMASASWHGRIVDEDGL
jgi:hypothetical protein